ncbi:hypothetical protein SEVIR_3G078200v4 [Setaria viridis]|uniref:Uncharacterized protein n=1 Tax=Setaria viridis TaxID=4556 RepID=A0A4U6VAR1_SETVI|nr:serine-aspartate repeat-containing protein C-like [Setaria viridis]TKW24873.1 hypothetical protein SEVIR_3G078200v2 [Setaria viridis]
MASAVVFSATILLLVVAVVFASVSCASHPLTAAEATDHAITKEKSNLLQVHSDYDKEMEEAKAARGQRGSATEKMTNLVSAEEEGKKTGSYWGKARKLDDDDDSDHGSDSDRDQDHDSDSDHDHDHDSDSDHDHDSDSDQDHDHDSDSDHDHDRDHDSDSDHDHDSDSDHDHDHDSDSGNNDDDDHNSKNERKKKHAAQGRKGAPGGKQ